MRIEWCILVVMGALSLALFGQEPVSDRVVIGAGASADAPGAIAIGAGATVRPSDELSNAIAIGAGAKAVGFPGVAREKAYETVALGENAAAQGWRCTAIGAKAQAGVVSATAIGRGAYAWGAHMIAIGRGAYMEKVEASPELRAQNACGIAGDSLWLGGMMCHRTVDRTGDTEVIPKENGGDGQARWPVRTFRPAPYTIHGRDAYDARFAQAPDLFDESKYQAADPTTWQHKVDRDVPGGDLALAAGAGTGTAAGGSLLFQTAPAGRESANAKNRLETAMAIDTRQAPGETRLLLLDPDTGKTSRVVVHTLEVDGKRYRVLGFPAE